MNDTEKNGTSASLKIYTHSERALSREVFPRNKRIAYTNSRKRWRNEWKRTVTVSNPTNVKEITHAPTARNLYKQKKTQYACFKTSKIAIERRRRPRNIKNVLKKQHRTSECQLFEFLLWQVTSSGSGSRMRVVFWTLIQRVLKLYTFNFIEEFIQKPVSVAMKVS